jgi:5-methylcytosine-specific restriction endonuclease McrA
MSVLSQHRVLVLNKAWAILRVVTVRQAIEMLANQESVKARVIDPSQDFATFTWDDWSAIRPTAGDDVIRGVGADFKIPNVIMVTGYDKLPYSSTNFSRRNIYRRDNNTCQYCGEKLPTEELTIEHINPRSRGGQTTWLNCVLACVKCNSQKANRLPEEAYRGRGQPNYDPVTCPTGWKGSSPMKLRKKPERPKLIVWRGDRKTMPKDWSHFVSEAYWSVELENENSGSVE